MRYMWVSYHHQFRPCLGVIIRLYVRGFIRLLETSRLAPSRGRPVDIHVGTTAIYVARYAMLAGLDTLILCFIATVSSQPRHKPRPRIFWHS